MKTRHAASSSLFRSLRHHCTTPAAYLVSYACLYLRQPALHYLTTPLCSTTRPSGLEWTRIHEDAHKHYVCHRHKLKQAVMGRTREGRDDAFVTASLHTCIKRRKLITRIWRDGGGKHSVSGGGTSGQDVAPTVESGKQAVQRPRPADRTRDLQRAESKRKQTTAACDRPLINTQTHGRLGGAVRRGMVRACIILSPTDVTAALA